ncbi:lipopolysaccharide core heptose(I) kinase RfaP [Cellvibrio mixtus]|uniref:Lipopolysaccharide core heptose(I) kinase RfaP n=1 Tax=Cellvibrio mixtus TaxID=39650 RepID=A0A266QE04_9GAMM|nr:MULTISPECIES: lipopolysaccharide core heptose(I) kinase RfaP [Cellvibrio]AQT61615.1 lipopolysaccharide core heptose(I) kinase RfaP [Cellvibrio sp. PSBB023]OZY87866.1 lipopolysaccharide core heptose(I) kinase RfaP [Cellvibrio mixtus]
MKLALVIFRYFPFGGLQRDMLAIAQAAQARGHQVTIFCGEWQGDKAPGIDVVEIKAHGLFNIAGVKKFVNAFQKQFVASQFDLLVGFNKMPGLDVYYCGDSCFAKKAYEERGLLYRLTPRAKLYLHYETAVYSHLSNTHILEVSAAERPVFAKYYATLDVRQTLLPPGVDRQLIGSCVSRVSARQKIRKELSLADNDHLILCVGSGFKTKGLDRSLRSFAVFRKNNPRALLVVVGNGDPRPFRALVKSLGLSDAVKFLGGRRDMADIYAAGDLLLHPAYKEVTGNVILEAMLSAIPVLVTPVCGYAHYAVDHAMGELLLAPDDAQTVAVQMEKLLAVDPHDWQSKAERFACESDIFSRPDCAVNEIERIAYAPGPTPLVQSAAASEWVLCDEMIEAWQHKDVFALVESLSGPIAREMPDRQTLRFELNGQGYYRKWHRGVGWREVIKNLICFRLPILGAKNEWEALTKLRALAIPSLMAVAYGWRGSSPASQQSFIVTRELDGVVQLDHYFEQHSVAINTRRLILHRLAVMARELHGAGINHRDFYLCHFMLKPASLGMGNQPDIYLIDLHRAQCRVRVPLRWQIKDLAALYYSTLNLGFSRRDILRFLMVYFDCPMREILEQKPLLLKQIQSRALKIYWRDFGHAPTVY